MNEDERFRAMARDARLWELMAARAEREAPEKPDGTAMLAPFWIAFYAITMGLAAYFGEVL